MRIFINNNLFPASMEVDDLTKRIDKLWISVLRGFDPNKIEYWGTEVMKRSGLFDVPITPAGLSKIYDKTDAREYIILPDAKKISLDCEVLNGWAGTGYMDTCDGYDSKKYLAFKNGLFGKESPKNPMKLSFKEALELYGGLGNCGDMGILSEYKERKKAYDLGVKAMKKWPNFLKE